MNRRKIILTCAIVLIVVLIAYMTISLYVSIKVKNIVDSACASYGQKNEYSDCVSDEYFTGLNHRVSPQMYNTESYEIDEYGLPVTFIFFNRAYSIYWYTYELKEKRTDKTLCGSTQVPVTVTLELVNGSWKVINVYEPA